MSELSKPAEDEQAPRREFLQKTACGLGACFGATLLAPLAAPALSPLLRDPVQLDGRRIDCGAAADFGPTPRKVPVVTERSDAWTRSDREVIGAIYIRRQEDGQLQAFSAICPHASCAVSFAEEQSKFVCPCHNTWFSAAGETLSGPSPRGLDSLPLEVENGRVFVSYKAFRPGIATKEDL
jgi:menaquinol-cytochrome c reductase iron-sulfur subunit